MPAGPVPSHTPGHPGRWRRLNSATTVLWRAPDVVQLELPDKSLVIRNVGPEQLSALLGRRSDDTVTKSVPDSGVERKTESGTDPARRGPSGPIRGSAVRLAERLHDAGFLTRRMPRDSMLGHVPAYLSADLAALVGRFGDDASAVLGRRRRSLVAIQGVSRISATLASTLAASGIGQVQLLGTGEASAADSLPGGLTPADEGTRFTSSGGAALRRASPDVSTAPTTGFTPVDLVVLTDPPPVDPAVRDGLHLDGQAHLAVSVEGSRGVIGPLVIPGRTSCLRCADLVRSEHDPGWPLLAVQLASRPRHARAMSETALAVATAGAAAGQVLGYLDNREAETLGGTMEWLLPDWRLRRRSWPAHPDCDCGAAARVGP